MTVILKLRKLPSSSGELALSWLGSSAKESITGASGKSDTLPQVVLSGENAFLSISSEMSCG